MESSNNVNVSNINALQSRFQRLIPEMKQAISDENMELADKILKIMNKLYSELSSNTNHGFDRFAQVISDFAEQCNDLYNRRIAQAKESQNNGFIDMLENILRTSENDDNSLAVFQKLYVQNAEYKGTLDRFASEIDRLRRDIETQRNTHEQSLEQLIRYYETKSKDTVSEIINNRSELIQEYDARINRLEQLLQVNQHSTELNKQNDKLTNDNYLLQMELRAQNHKIQELQHKIKAQGEQAKKDIHDVNIGSALSCQNMIYDIEELNAEIQRLKKINDQYKNSTNLVTKQQYNLLKAENQKLIQEMSQCKNTISLQARQIDILQERVYALKYLQDSPLDPQITYPMINDYDDVESKSSGSDPQLTMEELERGDDAPQQSSGYSENVYANTNNQGGNDVNDKNPKTLQKSPSQNSLGKN